MLRHWPIWIASALILTVAALAADPPKATDPKSPSEPTVDKAPAKTEAGTKDPKKLLNTLLKDAPKNELISPIPIDQPAAPGTLVGTAPDANNLLLKREGSYAVNKAGRIEKISGGFLPYRFVFRDESMPDMYLMPCGLLQDMEAIVQRHGDDIDFVLSGQIFVYRGDNYLLPTLMKLEPRRGNLNPTP